MVISLNTKYDKIESQERILNCKIFFSFWLQRYACLPIMRLLFLIFSYCYFQQLISVVNVHYITYHEDYYVEIVVDKKTKNK